MDILSQYMHHVDKLDMSYPDMRPLNGDELEYAERIVAEILRRRRYELYQPYLTMKDGSPAPRWEDLTDAQKVDAERVSLAFEKLEYDTYMEHYWVRQLARSPEDFDAPLVSKDHPA